MTIKRKREIFSRVALIITIAFLVWLAASFIDVNMHNSLNSEYGNFHEWNAFILFYRVLVA